MVKDKDTIPPQGDRPSGIKKQVPFVRDIAIQVNQPKYAPVKVPLEQLSGTPLLQAAMQTGQLQHLPIQAAREVHHVFILTVAMPDPFGQGVPRFNKKDISRFIKDYEGICQRYYIGKERKLIYLSDYCKDIYAEAIQIMPEFHKN